jgi:predicted Fe-Mo cluster-binding NifX family protein
MKYAITSTGDSVDALLDQRFGRCAWLVIYDAESRAKEFIPNPYREEETEVGPRVVELVDDRGVKRIISGSFGIRIKSLLDSKKIQMIIPGEEAVTVETLIQMIDDQ